MWVLLIVHRRDAFLGAGFEEKAGQRGRQSTDAQQRATARGRDAARRAAAEMARGREGARGGGFSHCMVVRMGRCGWTCVDARLRRAAAVEDVYDRRATSHVVTAAGGACGPDWQGEKSVAPSPLGPVLWMQNVKLNQSVVHFLLSADIIGDLPSCRGALPCRDECRGRGAPSGCCETPAFCCRRRAPTGASSRRRVVAQRDL